MITRYTHGSVTWVDLENPTSDEVRAVMEEFAIEPLVAEELLTPSLKPRVDLFPDYVYLILHFPAFKHTHMSAQQEVDFIVGTQFIITTRYDTIDPLHTFSKIFETQSLLDRSKMGEHAGYVFFYMVRQLYTAVHHELEFIANGLNDIEGSIFNGKEREMVVEISRVSRELLNFKRALSLHLEVLQSLETNGKVFFGTHFEYHLHAILGEYYRVWSEVTALLDSVVELRETNNSLVTTKQNEIMKVLTIMAFVTFPLSLFTSLFGMNTETLPLTGFPGDFWVIVNIMAVVTFFFFAFFKYKKWL